MRWTVLALGLAACGGVTDAHAPRPSLAFISPVQTDTVGQTLPIALAAKLTDAVTGAPLAGFVLNWEVLDGGQLFVPITQTGGDGTARNVFTLGRTAGIQRVVARYIDPTTGAAITQDVATITALPGGAALLWANSQPWPATPGIGSGIVAHKGQSFSLYYGFHDVFGNVTAPCGPITWDYSGDAGFSRDTIIPGQVTALGDYSTQQDFTITGDSASLIGFLARAACVQETAQAFLDHSDPPVMYLP